MTAGRPPRPSPRPLPPPLRARVAAQPDEAREPSQDEHFRRLVHLLANAELERAQRAPRIEQHLADIAAGIAALVALARAPK